MRYARIACLVSLLSAACAQDEPAQSMKTIGPFPANTWVLVAPEGNWATLKIYPFDVYSMSGTFSTSGYTVPVTGGLHWDVAKVGADCRYDRVNASPWKRLGVNIDDFSGVEELHASHIALGLGGSSEVTAHRSSGSLVLSVQAERTLTGSWVLEGASEKSRLVNVHQLGKGFIMGSGCDFTAGAVENRTLSLSAFGNYPTSCTASGTVNEAMTRVEWTSECTACGIASCDSYSTPFTWVRVE